MKCTIAQAQMRPKKGDYPHNLALIGGLFAQIAPDLPDVLCLPETCLSGYFLEGGVIEAARTAQEVFDDLQAEFAKRVGDDKKLDVTLGFYECAGGNLYNAMMYASLGEAGRIVHVHRKFFLPTYGVFDEKRFVSRGRNFQAFGTRLGPSALLVCEDLWHSPASTILALKGAQIIYVGAASPARGFRDSEIENIARWRRLIITTAEEHNLFVVFTSLVGFEGGRGLVGNSLLAGPDGQVLNEAPAAKDYLLRSEIDTEEIAVVRARSPMVADLRANLGDVAHEFDQIAHEIEEARDEPQAS